MMKSSTHRHRAALVILSAVLLGCIVTACQPGIHRDPSASFSLEIANDAADRVRVNVKIKGMRFHDVFTDPREPFAKGIVTLESGERRTFEMSSGIGPEDSQEDSRLVIEFGEVHFFEPGRSVPYRSYEYEPVGCVGGCGGDDTLYLHVRSDGVAEPLFLESPNRPFYLERDTEDGDLARIVITFVPDAENGVGEMAARR